MNDTTESTEPTINHERVIAFYIAGMMVLLVVAGLIIAWAI